MFPFSFEWVWDMGHMVFMGGLWFAMSILGAGMTYCVAKTLFDLYYKEEDGNHH